MAKYTVVMVRHGESEWNKENKFCGWFDADLSEAGVSEAVNAGKVRLDVLSAVRVRANVLPVKICCASLVGRFEQKMKWMSLPSVERRTKGVCCIRYVKRSESYQIKMWELVCSLDVKTRIHAFPCFLLFCRC